MTWIKKKIGPGVSNITTLDDAERILTSESKVVLGYLSSLVVCFSVFLFILELLFSISSNQFDWLPHLYVIMVGQCSFLLYSYVNVFVIWMSIWKYRGESCWWNIFLYGYCLKINLWAVINELGNGMAQYWCWFMEVHVFGLVEPHTPR